MKNLIYMMMCLLIVSCNAKKEQQDLKIVIDNALQSAEKQSLLMAEKYKDADGRLPRSYENGKDVSSGSQWWCSGFFPGTLWYLYENTHNPEILKYARLYTDRVEKEKYTTDIEQ